MTESYNPHTDQYSMYNPETCDGIPAEKKPKQVSDKTANTNDQVNQVVNVSGKGPEMDSDDLMLNRGPFGSTTDKIRLLREEDL